MRETYENQLLSSLLLWVDNQIQDRGRGWINHSGLFYNIGSKHNNFYTYAIPYGGFVSDFSITGATKITGVYLNNSFITTGVSGFTGINYSKGYVYFNSPVTGSLSGIYAFKEFNVLSTDSSETTLLFETKYAVRPKIGQTTSGIAWNQINYPAIFIRNNGGQNDPLAFGGMDTTISNFHAVVLADSLYNLDAICSIFKDSAREYIPLIPSNESPFNLIGGYRSGNYNYSNLSSGKTANANSAYIYSVYISRFNEQVVNEQLRQINPNVYAVIIDLQIQKPRFPRIF